LNRYYDIIVIGTGIAGLTSAIYLKEAGLNVLVVSKSSDYQESNTFYAQGGIIAWKKGDDPKSLMNDILKAGSNYNNYEAVEILAKDGPRLVFEFLIEKIGIKFSNDHNGKLDYTAEAAHSINRIIHFQDHTGDRISNSLYEYAKKIGVTILTGHTAVDIITNSHHSKNHQELYKTRIAMGVYLLNNYTGEVDKYLSDKLILATGGVGELYQYTTNPPCSTGDGISMATRAGADIINAEFIQFHPTLLFHKDIKRFLISESLRGEGAKLLTPDGRQFMSKYTEFGELDSRDVVSRAIYEEMSANGFEYMLLDLASYYKGEVPITERFYKIYSTCKSGGIDITKEPIPIVPAAHYFCGGIRVDTKGQTSLKNLYAIGEVSCTGLHGANRLASNSLLEALLWAKNTAFDIINNYNRISPSRLKNIPDWNMPKQKVIFDPTLLKQDMSAIKMTLSNYAGIVRSRKGLERASADLNYYKHRIFSFYKQANLTRDIIELRNAIVTAEIIVNSAMHNKRSIGCHYIRK